MNNNELLNLWLKKVYAYGACTILSLSFVSTTLTAQFCFRDSYRSVDGSCNNIVFFNTHEWGKANKPFFREIPANYSSEDIFNGMDFPNRPNPRAISNAIFAQDQSAGNTANLSSFVFTWGQFLDHDITLVRGGNSEPRAIPLPPDETQFTNDIRFNRSATYIGTGIFTPRRQENRITAWIDGSQVYGSDHERANWLRTFSNGKLKMSSGNLLPYNTINGEKNGQIDPNAPEMDGIPNGQNTHFVAGDVRANEQPGLTALHTLFVREHNRICDELATQGHHNDETIYQIARKRVGAIIQAITYEQFLPALNVELNPYFGYNSFARPDIMNMFATAAFRIGHTMVTSELLFLNDDCSPIRNPLSLEEGFFNNKWIGDFGIAPVLKGLSSQQQEAIDHKMVDGLRNFLFSIPQLPGSFGLDLAALNIQRGRDHGLPDYRTVREYFLGDYVTSFNQINQNNTIAQRLASTYNNNLNNLDLWVGLLAESYPSNKRMGPTLEAILKKQFERLRDGDYYFYSHDPYLTFSEKQAIQNTKLGDVIRRNTSLNTLATNVFFASPCTTPPLADCDAIKVNALDGQIEITNLNAPFVTVKVLDKNAGWSLAASCFGGDCGTTQTFNLPPSDYYVQITFYENPWRDQICNKDFEVSVEGSMTNTFSCDNIVLHSTDNNIIIDNLTAPFPTVKVFDKNAGWTVVAQCAGNDCNESTTFNLPAGDYYVQISAYEGVYQNLICNLAGDIRLEGGGGNNNTANCDAVTVNLTNTGIVVNNLTAPFSTVKVFDLNNGWSVAAQCAGSECAQNQAFNLARGNYSVEVTMYQGAWQNEICHKLFPINSSQAASSRNAPALQAAVFPNPVQHTISVDLAKYTGQAAELQLNNQFGQNVKAISIEKLTKELITIPVEDLVNGWYYLTIGVENRLPLTKKVVVHRLY